MKSTILADRRLIIGGFIIAALVVVFLFKNNLANDQGVRVETSKELISSAMLEKRPQHEEATELSILEGTESLPGDEQQSIARALSEARRAIRPLTDEQKAMAQNEGVHFFASNPGQQLTARFMDKGVRLESGREGSEWEGTLVVDHDKTPIEIRQQGSQIEYAYENMIEWYSNREDGLEHGYVVQERPEDAGEDSFRLRVRLDGLKAQALEDRAEGSSDLQFVDETGVPVVGYKKPVAWDANGKELPITMEPTDNGFAYVVADKGALAPITIDPLIVSLEQKVQASDGGLRAWLGVSAVIEGDTLLVGAMLDDVAGEKDVGSVYVFRKSGSTWVEEAKLIASDGMSGDRFGASLSLDGDRALISAGTDRPGEGDNFGSVYVFERSGSTWTETVKLIAPDGKEGDNFGASVALVGDRAFIGATYVERTTKAGAVYVFANNGSGWVRKRKITPDDADSGHFGAYVSVDGNRVLIASPLDHNENGVRAGAAYVYVEEGGDWTKEAKLLAFDLEDPEGDWFATAVSLDGDRALVGSRRAVGSRGHAFVFVRDGNQWLPEAKLSAPDVASGDLFGVSVSLNGDLAVIGASGDDDDIGSAHVFKRVGSSWVQKEKITFAEGESRDRFGGAVWLDGDNLVIASTGVDGLMADSGAAFIYRIEDDEVEPGTWVQQALITAPVSGEGDLLGSSVSLKGDTAVIGVPSDDTASGLDSGSAYSFVRSGAVWSQQSYLVASDAVFNMGFGTSVSLANDRMLVGAVEAKNSVLGFRTGAAYVFSSDSTGWVEEAKLLASDGSKGDVFGCSVDLAHNGYALIGAKRDDTSAGANAGSAYVFKRGSTGWVEEAKLEADDAAAEDRFGNSVSFFSSYALIGAFRDDVDELNDAGSAYVFVGNGGVWSQQAQLVPSDAAEGDEFGSSVSLYGGGAAIGAQKADAVAYNSGAAYYFRRSGSLWLERVKFMGSSTAKSDFFGAAVSLYGNRLLVGAAKHNALGLKDSGAAYVFERVDGDWTEQSTILADETGKGDKFGIAVSLDGDSAIIGANQDEVAGNSDAGSAHIYFMH